MMERMSDLLSGAWGAFVAISAGIIGIFYKHGREISALQTAQTAHVEQHKEIAETLKGVSRDVGDIKIALGIRGTNGKRRSKRG